MNLACHNRQEMEGMILQTEFMKEVIQFPLPAEAIAIAARGTSPLMEDEIGDGKIKQAEAAMCGLTHIFKAGGAVVSERGKRKIMTPADKHTDGSDIGNSARMFGNIKAPFIHINPLPDGIIAGRLRGKADHLLNEAGFTDRTIGIKEKDERGHNGTGSQIHGGAVVDIGRIKECMNELVGIGGQRRDHPAAIVLGTVIDDQQRKARVKFPQGPERFRDKAGCLIINNNRCAGFGKHHTTQSARVEARKTGSAKPNKPFNQDITGCSSFWRKSRSTCPTVSVRASINF